MNGPLPLNYGMLSGARGLHLPRPSAAAGLEVSGLITPQDNDEGINEQYRCQ